MPRDSIERIIGIDPGSIRCGAAVIERRGRTVVSLHWETIECGTGDFSGRLRTIYDRIAELCELYRPDRAAIEGIFHARNADSALKLGHARGVALLALAHANLSISEFQPAEIKKAVGSYGAADKDQVRLMVMRLLGIQERPGLDASDALAIALTAAYQRPQLVEASGKTKGLASALAQAKGLGNRASFQARVHAALATADAQKRRKLGSR